MQHGCENFEDEKPKFNVTVKKAQVLIKMKNAKYKISISERDSDCLQIEKFGTEKTEPDRMIIYPQVINEINIR